MILPDYWLTRPAMNLDDQARSEFDRLLAQIQSGGGNTLIEYDIALPKWQFLCYLADQHGIAMHGTGDANIRLFEPRQPVDLTEFGNQKAVYAAGDGIWATFFAVVDRERFSMWVTNACIRLADETGAVSDPYYVFSISNTALPQRPWRTGSVYLLPPETFTAQPPMQVGTIEVRIPQLASPVAVTPLARLEIAPEDFPFLNQIRGHEDARIEEYMHAMQNRGPWPE